MEVMGSEFIVEMVAGQRLVKGDRICTLEYIEGSDIDPEAAYSLADHPGGFPCGTCVRGGARGKMALVQFPWDLTTVQSVLLHTMKLRMVGRILAERYSWHAKYGTGPVVGKAADSHVED
jgi:hypothetical protein